MRITTRRSICLIAAGCLASVAIYTVVSINRSVQRALADERTRLIDKNRVPFEKKVLTPHLAQDTLIIQTTREARSLADFRGSYFAATGGGLVQLSYEGKMLRHFSVLDGLPESDLISMAVFGERLYIGTRTKGLLVFDGEKFTNYTWPDRQAQAVTSLLADGGELMVGTFGGGLLKFDGAEFTEIKADKERIASVNCVLKDGTRLYVGTYNNGIHLRENDTWTHLTTVEGLPSNRVVGLAVMSGKLYAATDFGLAVLDDHTFRSVAVMPSLSGLAARGNELLLTKDEGEIYEYDTTLKKFYDRSGLQNTCLVSTGDKTWFLSDQGISLIDGARLRKFDTADAAAITDNFVSALALDGRSDLWAGTFRHGVDVLSSDGSRLKHLETTEFREVNFLENDGTSVRAATTNGIFSFGKDLAVAGSVDKKAGLPSNSVNHFSGMVIATAKGLAFQDEGKFHLLSTVQGLPNNSTYTSLQVGNKLFVGTLGGLAQIEDRHVVRTYKDSNSGLKTNWVTSLCLAGERLFIGTYGGGVYELLPSGDIRSFEPETGKFTVNTNAMFSDGDRLYAGTLDGVRILDLQTQQWRTMKRLLPSETVMSVTGNASVIYFGTTSGIAKIDRTYFTRGEIE